MISIRVRAAATAVVMAGGLTAVMLPTARGETRYEPPKVNKVAPTVLATDRGGRTAFVVATYTCFGGNDHTHLYIGVKQGPEVNATTHTSSQYARTFYSTNWNADGPGDSINCNGVTHTQSFRVKPDPYWDRAHSDPPILKNGPAFVQFCVFDSTNSGADGDTQGFAFDYEMQTVQTF